MKNKMLLSVFSGFFFPPVSLPFHIGIVGYFNCREKRVGGQGQVMDCVGEGIFLLMK